MGASVSGSGRLEPANACCGARRSRPTDESVTGTRPVFRAEMRSIIGPAPPGPTTTAVVIDTLTCGW